MKKIILLTSLTIFWFANGQTKKKQDSTHVKEQPDVLNFTKIKEPLTSPYLNENNSHFYKNIDSTKASLYKMNVKKVTLLTYSSLKNKKQSANKPNITQFFPLQKLKDSIK